MSVTFDPYADEDASNHDEAVDASSLGDTEPPVLKAFSHIGKTFRQGGFCTPSPKRKNEKRELLAQDNAEKVVPDMAEPLPVEKEDKIKKDDKIVGSTPPLYILLVFISCVVSSMVFCYKPEISIAFERQVDDIMTSTQLYSFEISLLVAFIVLVTTKVCMTSDNTKAKLIQYVWATFVCILVGFVVFFLTKETKSEISPSKHSDAINDNNHVEKKEFFQNLFKMKQTT